MDLNQRGRSLSYPEYKLYRRRFYVLFVFSFLSFNQCLFWITFSPIYNETKEHYNITESTIDLLLAWGPICFLPCLPLTYILLNRSNGLRYCVLLLGIIPLIATIIRIIPYMIISSTDPRFPSISLPFLHVGQIFNSICGPLAMAPVSQISSLWFDTNERTRATTIAIMSYNLGSTTGFLLGPSVVYVSSHLPNLLYIHVGLALIGCILVLIYFPGQPPTPPSPAAELLIKHSNNKKENEQNLRSYFDNLIQCFRTRSFVFLVLAGGLIGGTFGAWTSLFDIILTPEHYTDKQTGWFGFCTSIAEIIGGISLGILADMPRFHHSFKILILISYCCYFLSVCWFNLSIGSLLSSSKLLPSNWLTIGISVTLAGFFQGSALPLTYESIAEIMYPLPESLSASILVEFINLTTLALYFIAPNHSKLMNFIICIIIFICIILIVFTKFSYKRRDADRTKRHTLVQMDINLLENQLDDIQLNSVHITSFTNPIIDLQNES
ncbi:hypothetical protein I4U23_022745 [Adineta vaga]|nr:hypothetical protein I4U23_022745 [Adineta vaga]